MEISEDEATIYLGDYDYYLEKKAELEELARLEAEENQVSEEVQVASAVLVIIKLKKPIKKRCVN